jgi:ElaB/YqjD/DUF883 family membrane-anchored ribosome-binding protein
VDTDTTLGQPAPALAEVLDALNDLLQLDHDAIAAYDVAIEKLEDRDHASQIAGFRRDHERHIRELNELVLRLGGTPKNEPHLTGPFKTAMQSLGGLAGDKGLLLAWRTNELQVRTKYDHYASKAMLWPPDVKRVVDGAALDEERHYAWVADVLQRMGVGHGEDPAVHEMNAARERANVGGGVVSRAKESVVDAAGAVGEKVSGLAGSVGGRVGDVAGAVGERAAGLAGSVGERASGLAGSVRERVAGGAGAVRNRISGLLDTEEGPLSGPAARVRGGVDGARGAAVTFEERVHEKPLQTLLVAGIAGFVIGRLLR